MDGGDDPRAAREAAFAKVMQEHARKEARKRAIRLDRLNRAVDHEGSSYGGRGRHAYVAPKNAEGKIVRPRVSKVKGPQE